MTAAAVKGGAVNSTSAQISARISGEDYSMTFITFETTVGDEQVIRPPADVRLPPGALEVTIRTLPKATGLTPVDSANESLRRCRAALGHATGIDNDGIDADLARGYADGNP